MNNDDKNTRLACQIIIQPVENGFVIQALNVDGTQSERRLIATKIQEVRRHIHKLADALYESISDFDVQSRTDYSAVTKEE
jgi:hypothetical protein